MDLVILEPDVVLEDGVPLLEDNLVPAGSGLGGDELLEVADGVVFVALDSHLLAQSVINGNFDHFH